MSTHVERLVGPRLPDWRTVVVSLVMRRRVRRELPQGREITDDGLRRQAARVARAMAQQRQKLPAHVAIEETELGGLPAEWVRVRDVAADARKVVLYLHGGGFFLCSPRTHRPLTWRLSRASGRRVVAIDYRMAPEHAWPAWVDDAEAAWRALLASGLRASDIVVAGDSAGGNLALALTHRLRRQGQALPEALVLFSPWADLTCAGASMRSNARWDAMFDPRGVEAMARYLTRACDARHPEVSPVYGDYRGLPRLLVFAGSTEVMLDDARTVVRRAHEAGVEAELHVYRHLPHVFPMFAGVLPRAKPAFAEITRFLAQGQPVAEAPPLTAVQ